MITVAASDERGDMSTCIAKILMNSEILASSVSSGEVVYVVIKFQEESIQCTVQSHPDRQDRQHPGHVVQY